MKTHSNYELFWKSSCYHTAETFSQTDGWTTKNLIQNGIVNKGLSYKE